MNRVRRVNSNLEDPQFPKWQAPQSAAGFLVGTLLWILMLILFLFLFYVQLFSYNTQYLLNLVHPKSYHVPFWLSVIVVVFLFPVSLGVIVVGALIKLLRD